MFNKIKQLCVKKGISIARLEKELGFGNATIQGWGKGSKPTVDKLKAVADYFSVTVDYLLKE